MSDREPGTCKQCYADGVNWYDPTVEGNCYECGGPIEPPESATTMTGPNDLLRHFGVDPDRIPRGTRYDDLVNVLVAGRVGTFDDPEGCVRVQSSLLGPVVFASRTNVPEMDTPGDPWQTRDVETLRFPMTTDEFDRCLARARDWVLQAGEYVDLDHTYR